MYVTLYTSLFNTHLFVPLLPPTMGLLKRRALRIELVEMVKGFQLSYM